MAAAKESEREKKQALLPCPLALIIFSLSGRTCVGLLVACLRVCAWVRAIASVLVRVSVCVCGVVRVRVVHVCVHASL
eukprot:12358035-Alexandrium_andersonii.AAC.2